MAGPLMLVSDDDDVAVFVVVIVLGTVVISAAYGFRFPRFSTFPPFTLSRLAIQQQQHLRVQFPFHVMPFSSTFVCPGSLGQNRNFFPKAASLTAIYPHKVFPPASVSASYNWCRM